VSFDAQKLYDLLPAIHRIRDAEQGEPLKALLALIATQTGALEENLSQLYDDQFVETCASWVLPYIGDLIGIGGLPSSAVTTLSPRAEVAHTLGYRRRKGTAAMLEQLARDVSGWPARAVEFFQLIAATQYMNHLRPENRSFVSIRGAERLEYLGSAFERGGPAGITDLTHTVDVRRIAKGHGKYNIPNVGVFLWRLRAMSITRSQAVAAAGGDLRRFYFNPLGMDQPLFNLPETETEVTHLADPIHVPDRIRRRVLARNFESYYGRSRSLLLELAGAHIDIAPEAIADDEITVCDLSGWTNLPQQKIAIDPVLGRIAFPQDQTGTVLVTFHYGFNANMGGGEYSRLSPLDTRRAQVVRKVSNTYVKDAAQSDYSTTVAAALSSLGPKGGIVEIVNSGRYAEDLSIDASGKLIEIRAADKRKPAVLLAADLEIIAAPDSEVVFDGLLIAGGSLRVKGEGGRLRLRHCTLVPGISRNADGAAADPGTPSLIVASPNTSVEIDRCILGGIRAARDAEFVIRDSIVDATDETIAAYVGTDDDPGGFAAPLRIANSTVIGIVRTSILRLASNCIFQAEPAGNAAPVSVERRQEGCVRFSFLPPGAQTPARYRCQPENDSSLVRPYFVSTRFQDAGFCQLSPFCPAEIRRGADDESEMGAFHDLFEPQREAHLRARIEEYLRFGLEAGIFYAT
jgi:hypothetical protein